MKIRTVKETEGIFFWRFRSKLFACVGKAATEKEENRKRNEEVRKSVWGIQTRAGVDCSSAVPMYGREVGVYRIHGFE